MPDIKLGSLFDGIGVFPLAASRCGIRPVWASEIEKAPISITKRGALSIVRYRTAVKDPMDLLYLFWAITSGIAAGAGMYLLVVVAGAVMIGMLALFYSHQDKGRVYIAVIHYASDAVGDDITRAFGRTKFFVKSKTMRGDHVEMAVEVFCDDKDMTFAERIRAIEGVEDVTLIQYNGEYHG